MNRYDRTFLKIAGIIDFQRNFSIGRGCRFDSGPGAASTFGSGYVAAQSTFIIRHDLTVGDGCAISWCCQFLDEDFHRIDYTRKKEKSSEIVIRPKVWIGSNVSVHKGAIIPDGRGGVWLGRRNQIHRKKLTDRSWKFCHANPAKYRMPMEVDSAVKLAQQGADACLQQASA